MDTKKQRQCRCDGVRLTKSGNVISEQLLVVPTESLTNRQRLLGELLSGSERRRPGWFIDMKYQTCYTVCSVLKVYRAIICRLCSLCITGTALTLRAAINALRSVSHMWFDIGLQLGVPLHRIHSINTEKSSEEAGLVHMLDYWMNNAADPSWEDLVNALKNVRLFWLAMEVEIEYCSPDDHSSLGEWEVI